MDLYISRNREHGELLPTVTLWSIKPDRHVVERNHTVRWALYRDGRWYKSIGAMTLNTAYREYGVVPDTDLQLIRIQRKEAQPNEETT